MGRSQAIAYQLLGFLVWKGGKLYLRRRYGVTPATAGKAAAGVGVGLALVTGAVVAGRHVSNSRSVSPELQQV